MNSAKVRALTNVYLQKFDERLSGKKEDPRKRWLAEQQCANTWDINSNEFGTMFASSMQEATPYLEKGKSHPVEGIIYLCQNGYEADVAREFAQLLEPDGGDLDARQNQINLTKEHLNSLLNEAAPSEWQYRQKKDSVLGYLSFIRPEEDFWYCAAETAAFVGYAEAEDDLGVGSSFRLSSYYLFCNQLSAYLMSREDLQAKITESWQTKKGEKFTGTLMEVDPSLHLLTADFIHAAYIYDYYEVKEASRKTKMSAIQQRRIERTKQQSKLLEDREKTEEQLEEVQEQVKEIQIPSMLRMTVSHKAFGEGKVTEHEGRYLTVEFKEQTRKFALPGAVVNGYLTFDQFDDVRRSCENMEKMEKKRRRISDKLDSIDVQLKMLEA